MEERHVSLISIILQFSVFEIYTYIVDVHNFVPDTREPITSWRDITGNLMGCSTRPNQDCLFFCERVKDEAMHWESRHQDALMGRYTHRQKRKEVP